MGLLLKLFIYGAIIATLAGASVSAWHRFSDWIGEPYAERQRAVDQKVINQTEARAIKAEGEARSAADAARLQSESITRLSSARAAAEARAGVVLDAYAKVIKSSEGRLDALRARAQEAPPAGLSCQQTLSNIDQILRDSARVRQREAP